MNAGTSSRSCRAYLKRSSSDGDSSEYTSSTLTPVMPISRTRSVNAPAEQTGPCAERMRRACQCRADAASVSVPSERGERGGVSNERIGLKGHARRAA